MVVRKQITAVCASLCFAGLVYGQAVSFHSPVPWITLRENKIIAKTLIDTAEVKNNDVTLTLSKVVNGRKSLVASKKIKTVDYSQELELAGINEKILGGRDFLRIDWRIAGTDKKGMILPFGIYEVGEISEANAVVCKKGAAQNNAIVLGAGTIGLSWNPQSFDIVCTNIKGFEQIIVAVDGKNGKNAFLAFADRFVAYYPAADSLHAWYYKRGITNEVIQYDEKPWTQEISKNVKDDVVTITIPWHDLGMLAADGRIFGLSVFAKKTEKETTAFPESARQEIPGTWGNVVLKE